MDALIIFDHLINNVNMHGPVKTKTIRHNKFLFYDLSTTQVAA